MKFFSRILMLMFSFIWMMLLYKRVVSRHIDVKTTDISTVITTPKCKVEREFPTFSIRQSSNVTMKGVTTPREKVSIIPLLAELSDYDNRLNNLYKEDELNSKVFEDYFTSKSVSNHRIEELGFQNGEINPIGIEELIERTDSDRGTYLEGGTAVQIRRLEYRRYNWASLVALRGVLDDFFSTLFESLTYYGIKPQSLTSGKIGPYQMETSLSEPFFKWRMREHAIYGYIKKDRRLCEKIYEPELKHHLTCGVYHFEDPWLYLQPVKFERISEDPHITMYYDVLVEKEKQFPKKLQALKHLEKEEFSFGSVYYKIPNPAEYMPISQRYINAITNGKLSMEDLRIEGTSIGYARKFPAESAVIDMANKDKFKFLRGQVWTIFLNEPCFGGEVVFPNAELRVKPKRNALLSVSVDNFKNFNKSRSYSENCPSIIGHQWVLSQRKFHIESRNFLHSGDHKHLSFKTKYARKVASIAMYLWFTHDEL